MYFSSLKSNTVIIPKTEASVYRLYLNSIEISIIKEQISLSPPEDWVLNTD